MWWFLPTALAGSMVAPVLALRCDDPEVALRAARAYWRAEALSPAAVGLELSDNPMCCAALTVRAVDAAGARLPGSLSLNSDCTLLGVSNDDDAGHRGAPRQVHPLGPPTPDPTGASLLRPAYEALMDRSDRRGDLLVGVRTRGWEVWLVRPNAYDHLTVARAVFDRDGTLREVVDEVRPWVPPAGAEAARTVWSIEGVR